jgi:hypothetical protein
MARSAPPGTPPQAIVAAAREALPQAQKAWSDKLNVVKTQLAERDRQRAEHDRLDFHADAEADRAATRAMAAQNHADSMEARMALAKLSQQSKGWDLFQDKDGKILRINKDTGEVKPVDTPSGISKVGPARAPTAELTPDAKYDAAKTLRETGKMPQLGLSASSRIEVENEASRQRRAFGTSVEADLARAATVTADSRSLANMQKQADAAESFEATAKKNFQLAISLAPKGVPTNLGPFINRWVQNGSSMFGDKDVPPYVAALLTGADEYAKVMSGSTGAQGSTVDSRRTAAELFSGAYNVDQIKSVVEGVAYKDMDNRTASYTDALQAIRDRIKTGGADPKKSETKSPSEYTFDPKTGELVPK